MLHESVINSLSQVKEILTTLEKLPNDVAVKFYIDDNGGKHIRHILDHFLAFLSISDDGILDYNLRNRESIVEQSWDEAQKQLDGIIEKFISNSIEDKELKVISEIDVSDTKNSSFNSNTARELLYLINHTMHHAAYIKLLAKQSGVIFSPHIGIAPSTASFLRKKSA